MHLYAQQCLQTTAQIQNTHAQRSFFISINNALSQAQRNMFNSKISKDTHWEFSIISNILLCIIGKKFYVNNYSVLSNMGCAITNNDKKVL